MKNIISLYNRDGAILTLTRGKKIDTTTNEWNLTVDDDHMWVMEHCRIIGNLDNIEAIDPSGGPFLAVGDMIRKYQIIKIVDCTTFWLSERNNN